MALPQLGYQMVLEGSNRFLGDMRKVNQATEDTNRGMSRASRAAQKLDGALDTASTVGIAAIAGMGVAAIKMGQDFETSFAKVETLFPGAEASVGHLKDQMVELSQTMGQDLVGQTDALYQALSAGVPQDNVMTFMETASKAAIGGSIELTQSVDVLTSVMNAFKIESGQAEQVSDLLFTTVARGKTDMNQLSASMFQVAPAAASAGIEFKEVAAALASITKQGVPTSVATTQLRQAIVELQKPGAELQKTLEAIGFESGAAALEALGLQGTLAELEQEAASNGKTLTQVFSSVEAGSAALALTGQNAQIAADDLKAMEDAAGATTAAFQTMDETGARKAEKAFQRFRTELAATGQDLLPIVGDIADAASTLLGVFSDLDGGTQRLILTVGGIVTIAPKVISALQAMGVASSTSRLKLVGLTSAVGALAIGADVLLEKTTGAGLIDRVFGDVAKTEAQAAAIGKLEFALRNASDQADEIRILAEQLGNIGDVEMPDQSALENFALGSDARLFGFDVGMSDDIDQWKEYEATVRSAAQALKDAGADAMTLRQIHNSLSEDLQGVFLEALGTTREELLGLGTQHSNVAMAATEHEMANRGLNEAAKATAQSLEESEQTLQRTPTAMEGARQAFNDLALELGDAEQGIRDYGAAWQEVLKPLAETNPEVLKLNSEIAILDSKIAALKGSNDELSEAQQAQLDSLQDQRTQLVEQRDVFTTNAQTVDTLTDSLIGLTGVDISDMGSLTQELQEQGASGEDLVGIYGELQSVFNNTDTSSAVGQLEDLKQSVVDNFGEGAWDAIIDAIGPELAQGFVDAEPEVKTAAREAGVPVPGEFSKGIETAIGDMQAGGDAVTGAIGTWQPGINSKAEAAGRPIPGKVKAGVMANAGEANAAGFSLASGIAAGMDSFPWWGVVQQLKSGILGIFGMSLGISSPSRVMAERIGYPISEGVAQGIEDGSGLVTASIKHMVQQLRHVAESELPAVADQFRDAVAGFEFRAMLEQQLGGMGADIAVILNDALADPEGRYGESLFRAVREMIDEAKAMGVENAEVLGSDIIEALRLALESGKPALVDAAIDLIDELDTEMQAAAEPGRSLVDAFMDGYNGARNDRRLEERVGSDGARLIRQLREGIANEEPGLLENIGGLVDRIIQDFQEGMDPGEANSLTSRFIDAIRTAIEEKGGEALAELAELLAEIQRVGEGTEGAGGGSGGTGGGGTGSGSGGGGGSGSPPTDIRADSDWYNPRTGTEYRIAPGGHLIEYRRAGSNSWYTLVTIRQGQNAADIAEERGYIPTPEGGITLGGGDDQINLPADHPLRDRYRYWDELPGWVQRRYLNDWRANNQGAGGPGVPNFQTGLGYVPSDNFLANLHRGEAVLTSEQATMWRAAMAPWAAVANPGGGAPMGGGGGTSVVVDLRNSTFTGTPHENGAAIERAVNRVIAQNVGQQAMIQGIRRSR